jgi:hypothetical protein
LYEERIILLRAESAEAAIEKAEEEARQYCSDLNGCEYSGLTDVYNLYDEEIQNGTEVYSSMRTSDLGPGRYLDHFYPELSVNCETEGKSHRWHRRDAVSEACYHCSVVRQSEPS